jgi:hypothetical protein
VDGRRPGYERPRRTSAQPTLMTASRKRARLSGRRPQGLRSAAARAHTAAARRPQQRPCVSPTRLVMHARRSRQRGPGYPQPPRSRAPANERRRRCSSVRHRATNDVEAPVQRWKRRREEARREKRERKTWERRLTAEQRAAIREQRAATQSAAGLDAGECAKIEVPPEHVLSVRGLAAASPVGNRPSKWQETADAGHM